MLRRAVGLFRLKDSDHGPWKVCVSHSASSPFSRSTSYFLYRYACIYMCIGTRGCLYHSPSTLYIRFTICIYFILLYTIRSLIIIFFTPRIFTTIMNEIESKEQRRRRWEATYGKNEMTLNKIIYVYIMLYCVYTCICLYTSHRI